MKSFTQRLPQLLRIFRPHPPKSPMVQQRNCVKNAGKATRKKFRKQQSLLAPDENYLCREKLVRAGRGNGKRGTTKALPQITLFATYEAALFPFLFHFFFFCLRRGLKTFNNAPKLPSDFFHIINLVLRSRLM